MNIPVHPFPVLDNEDDHGADADSLLVRELDAEGHFIRKGNHGGPRPGSGRKPVPAREILPTFTDDPLLTVREAGDYARRHPETIRSAVRAGQIVAMRAPGRCSHILIRLSALNSWLQPC